MRNRGENHLNEEERICGSGRGDMWKSWRVTSCCISEICQKERLVGESRLTESCRGRADKVAVSGESWRAGNYTGKEPGADAGFETVLVAAQTVCTQRLGSGSRVGAWQRRGSFFFWLCHVPILTIVTFCLEEEEMILLHLAFLWRWHGGKAEVAPGTKQKREICSLQLVWSVIVSQHLGEGKEVKKPQSGPRACPALPSLLEDRSQKGL